MATRRWQGGWLGAAHARALMAGVTLAWAAPAAAQETPATALLREGIELRRAGRDAEALARFERAHAVEPSPRTLAQMGLAEQALGRWVRAEAHLRAALAPRDDAWIERNRAALDAARGCW